MHSFLFAVRFDVMRSLACAARLVAMIPLALPAACAAGAERSHEADSPAPAGTLASSSVPLAPLEDDSSNALAVAPTSIAEVPALPGPETTPPLAGDPQDALSPPPPAFARVDWLNREYLPGWLQLVAGRGEVHDYLEDYGGMHDTTMWLLESVAYGDLTGDITPEAAVLIGEAWYAPEGGQRRTGLLFVFTATKSGAARHLASSQAAPPGDRVAIEAGHVVVFSGAQRIGAWKVDGDRLVPVL